MCGINGIVSNTEIPELSKRLQAMNQALVHRGPDGDGVELISPKCGFGHRRLAIIDLDDRSSQPMRSNSGETFIIYNGEIFNYLALKEELKKDYAFKTHSDTEVLLAGYELKGLDWLLSNINGMFAFALYDQKQETYYLIRDRFGIKPLYYYLDGEKLIFSSEIKGILHSGLVEARFNILAIDDYLGHRYVREPYTFFEGIYQVKSAGYLEIGKDLKCKEKKYWELPPLNFQKDYQEAEIIRETKQQIVDAVNRWKIADVRVGAYLSGGVDSSLTTAILAQSNPGNLDTYTIGFQEKGYNEFAFAQMVAEKYRTRHRAFLMEEKDYFAEWQKLIGYKDAPLAVPNEIPLAIMSTQLSKDITVVISGEGADELFGGYGRIFRSAFDFQNHPNLGSDFYTYFREQYEYVSRPLRDKYLKYKENYRNIFDHQILSDFQTRSNEENIFRFFHHYHIKGLLNRVDMTTMQASVEARPPFLDHQLIEYVYTKVPYEMKLKWKSNVDMAKAKKYIAKNYSEHLDIPKYILKEVAGAYLPEAVISRKKMGFPVPLNHWFPQLETYSRELLPKADWLNTDLAAGLSTEIKKNGSGRTGQLLWMFLNIELFRNKYFSKKWTW